MPGLLRAALTSLLLLAACQGSIPDVGPAPTVASQRAASDRAVALRDPTTGAWSSAPSLRTVAEKQGHIRVIVGLRAPFTPEGDLADDQARASQRQAIALARDAVLRAVVGTQTTVLASFDTIPYLAVRTNADGLEALLADDGVMSLHEDVPQPPALATSVPLVGGTAAYTAGYTGLGQTIAVLDSGVDGTHAFLSGKVVAEACYSSNDTTYSSTTLCPGGATSSTATGSGVNCATTLNGCNHGTVVAGIAVGKDATSTGVAKDATMISIQVFSQFTGASCGALGTCALTFPSECTRCATPTRSRP